MIETIVTWTEIVAFAIISLHIISEFVVNKPDNRIEASLNKVVTVVILTGFCCLLYLAIRGIYHISWVSYLLIVLAFLYITLFRKKYLRSLKKAITILQQ